jgi:hypothetical protein
MLRSVTLCAATLLKVTILSKIHTCSATSISAGFIYVIEEDDLVSEKGAAFLPVHTS